MKRLIICCDGTQNDPDQMDRDRIAPTNVVKISRAINEVDKTGKEDIPQIIYYDPGVGTGWWAKKVIEGMSGTGISENIIQAYAFLSENYQEGDEIFCFGFSRGAFTVRSLCGMINRMGLISKKKAKNQDYYDLTYKLYLISRPGQDRQEYFKSFRKRYTHQHEIKIKFLGVWDTVGSLGLPVLGNSTYEWNKHHEIFNFKETVQNAAHAVAIDERRNQFRPRFLSQDMVENEVEQKWFIGSHSNVGGGYVDAGLSDIALEWMIEKGRAYGLKFDQHYIDTHIFPEPLGEIRDSQAGMYSLLGSYVRTINGNKIPADDLHESVLQRFMEVTTDYNPLNTELSSKQNVREVMNTRSTGLTNPAEQQIEGLGKKYRNLRKKERPARSGFGKLSDSLSTGLVVFLLIWFFSSFFWLSSGYCFNHGPQDWISLGMGASTLFAKVVIAPVLIFLGLLMVLVTISFVYSKIWQLRQKRKYLK